MPEGEIKPTFIDAKKCAECGALLVAAEVYCPVCRSSEFVPAKGSLMERPRREGEI